MDFMRAINGRPRISLRQLLWARYSPQSLLLEILFVIPLMLLAFASRFFRSRENIVGLGPQPLINNYYHKQALQLYGYRAETFVSSANYITDRYDIHLGRKRLDLLPPLWKPLYLFLRALFHYKVLFIYFNGGPLMDCVILKHIEPYLYKIAELRILVMPYGSDVQNLALTPNLYFRHAMSVDYPTYHRRYDERSANVMRWTQHADWIISGCEWVDYMGYWDTLMLGHFSIDMEQWRPEKVTGSPQRSFRILHAPNHPKIKGTDALMKAVDILKSEGLDIELIILRGVPNSEIQAVMSTVDIVADQFVMGWYAMFAIEAMSMEKPVLCYIRPDLLDLYTKAGLIEPHELPLLNTHLLDIADQIRWAYLNRDLLPQLGKRGRAYVEKHHSTKAVGAVFADILSKLDIPPSQKPAISEAFSHLSLQR
jgi:glycosyltransferase involved in cell wall biosynthesis